MTGRAYFKQCGINLNSLTIEMICSHLNMGSSFNPYKDKAMRNLRGDFLYKVTAGETDLSFREWLLIQEIF
jgi:hypothetical protein